MSAAFDRIRDWLLESGGQATGLLQLSEQLCHQLRDAGLAIDRMNLGVFALHPEMAGYAVLWDRRRGTSIEVPVRREDTLTPTYLDSPIRWLVSHGGTLRVDLRDEAQRQRFPVFQEFADEGYCSYDGYCLRYGDEGTAVLSFCSASPDGISDSQHKELIGLFSALQLVIHLVETRRLAQTVLQTYLGRDTSRRVLSGEILRGQGELINAALWLCDLRGFTALASRISPDELIETMNTYFDTMAAAVWAEGGEILKFMGDAMLVVFRIDDDHSVPDVAAAALRAATDAHERLASLSQTRRGRGQEPLKTGIAIHLGEVIYGNIGASTRLDFTVMGPAVNLLARLQSLTSEQDQELLLSEAIAQALSAEVDHFGRFTLKGLAEPISVFRPASV